MIIFKRVMNHVYNGLPASSEMTQLVLYSYTHLLNIFYQCHYFITSTKHT